jgi:hypothetical protein
MTLQSEDGNMKQALISLQTKVSNLELLIHSLLSVFKRKGMVEDGELTAEVEKTIAQVKDDVEKEYRDIGT